MMNLPFSIPLIRASAASSGCIKPPPSLTATVSGGLLRFSTSKPGVSVSAGQSMETPTPQGFSSLFKDSVKSHERELGGGVVRISEDAHKAYDGTYIDDISPALLQIGQKGLDGVPVAVEMEFHGLVQLLVADVLEVIGQGPPGRVDEDVGGAELLDCFAHDPLNILALADVQLLEGEVLLVIPAPFA